MTCVGCVAVVGRTPFAPTGLYDQLRRGGVSPPAGREPIPYSALVEIATPVCALARNDKVIPLPGK